MAFRDHDWSRGDRQKQNKKHRQSSGKKYPKKPGKPETMHGLKVESRSMVYQVYAIKSLSTESSWVDVQNGALLKMLIQAWMMNMFMKRWQNGLPDAVFELIFKLERQPSNETVNSQTW